LRASQITREDWYTTVTERVMHKMEAGMFPWAIQTRTWETFPGLWKRLNGRGLGLKGRKLSSKRKGKEFW
jgi:hypothetical protein